MNLRKYFSTALLAVLLVGIMILAVPAGSAAAQAPTPQPKDPQAKAEKAGLRLEKAFQMEQRTLERQTRHFERVDTFIGRVTAQIEKAKANGKDTTKVEAALAQLKSKESEAKQAHADAANILKIHAGFDANGKVTERSSAQETLKSAGEKMKEPRSFFVDAMKALREAVKNWRQAK